MVSRCGAIAARLQRSPDGQPRAATQRQFAGAGESSYRAKTAHAMAYERACRPQPSKLAVNWRYAGESRKV